MKGALGLLAICAVIWVFWMTAVWVKRTKNKNKED
jgi:hypothetical protein